MDELTNLASTHPDLLEPTSMLQRLRHMIEVFHIAAMSSEAPTPLGNDSLLAGEFESIRGQRGGIDRQQG